jgi:hypothetical protein
MALDLDPGNQAIRRDLADHLDEVGDPDAEPVRWLADHGGWPRPPQPGAGPSDVDCCWNWWGRSGEANTAEWVPRSAILPQPVAEHLGGTADGNPYGAYPTRREAEADFRRAFHFARAGGWVPE